MANHLVNSSSPYLLQHANNPVDWYPWGEEALEKARREDKPIFLSIGYAACHWCHVMAHESFEDADTAALMNTSFVNIKVDREERLDLDSIFMSFVVAITGQGGWPMSVFLTPDGKPFYGGTYFPPRASHNLPAFRELLETIARLWKQDRSRLISSSEDILARMQIPLSGTPSMDVLNASLLEEVSRTIAQGYDWQNGGWGGAPKFPQPMLIEFLLRQGWRGDQVSTDMAIHALKSMAQGGMYDLLGGGFARYSVDPTWFIPHFEKMLYDNAQLARVYLHAFQWTGNLTFRKVCEETLDFVLREMTHPGGGFFSSLDADSEGEEGKFYLWSAGEIRSALPVELDAELFMRAYGISDQGSFEGRNILRQLSTHEQLASEFNLKEDEVSNRLENLRSRILEVRSTRVRPNTDDKVLVSWNGLMLATLAEAGRSLGRADYLQAAVRNANFILDHMLTGDRLMRSWREGQSAHNAYLEDYSSLVLALISLYQADPNPRWYIEARKLLEVILAHFSDPQGGFFDTRDDHEVLLYRPKDLQDNATPSGNALAATALLLVSTYEGRSDLRTTAEQMLASNLEMIKRYPSAFGQWLCAADFAVGPVQELAIIGDPTDPATQALIQPVWQRYLPRLLLAASSYPPPTGSPALLQERPLVNEKPTAYVCQGFRCQLPVNKPEEMLDQLG